MDNGNTPAGSTTATVEVLTAEVRVLMVGSRQITLSVARQLDHVEREDLTPWGRVRLDKGSGVMLIGVDESGQLAISHTAPYAYRGVRLDDIGQPLIRCREHFDPPLPYLSPDNVWSVTIDGDRYSVYTRAWVDCGLNHHAVMRPIEDRKPACEWMLTPEQSAGLRIINERSKVDHARAKHDDELPLIVLAGLR